MSSSTTSGDGAEQWRPTCGAFRAYTAVDQQQVGDGQLAADVSIVVKLTKDIIQTYHHCNTLSYYLNDLNLKICLTSPSIPVSNGGLDNENRDLILYVNDVLFNEYTNHRYIIKGLLGHGTFGQVARCWSDEKNDFVAVKVIKNHPAYGQQAIVETSILLFLNGHHDPDDTHHIVRIVDNFTYKGHICIVFEMLGPNLYELLQKKNHKGISLNLIRIFSKQILIALALLRDAGVIHCDLKPENILLTNLESAGLKVIDFGSSCKENQTVYSYIQSRYYRSPEVVLGHQYTTAIDMWSFGCIAVELFLGLPLFPAGSPYDLLQRMMKILGGRPPDHILKSAKNTSKFFQQIGIPCLYSEYVEGYHSAYQFLTLQDFEKREMRMPVIGKHYFSEDWNLEKIIMSYHLKNGLNLEEIDEELKKRLVFTDFVRGLLNFDPSKRWTPRQAAQHPFVTQTPFVGPFQPPLEAPRMPVHQGMNVDHNPVSGHWLGAGLSPQVNASVPRFGSPRYHQRGYSYESSHGSAGSYRSYSDHYNGSFADSHRGLLSHQMASTARNPAFGFSPDTRLHSCHALGNNGLGQTQLGLSPSRNFMPLSLGASPTSHIQHWLASASTGSSSKYWPSSPARSSGSGASSLGKAAVRQFNKRRTEGGSPVFTVHMGNSGACTRPQTQAHNMESPLSSYKEDTSPLDSPHQFSDQGVRTNTTNAAVLDLDLGQMEACRLSIYPTDSLRALNLNTQSAHNPGDDIPLANWDPNFSEDMPLENEDTEGRPGRIQSHSSSLGESSLQGRGASIWNNSSSSINFDVGKLQYGPQFSARRQASNIPLMRREVHETHDYDYGQYWRHFDIIQPTQHIPPSGLGPQTYFFPYQQQQQQQQLYQYSVPNIHPHEQPAALFPFLHPKIHSQIQYQGQMNVGLSGAFAPSFFTEHK